MGTGCAIRTIVQEAPDKLAKGRTTLVIVHRLSTIRGADKIFRMDRESAVDEGTHEEFLSRGGIYTDLYRLQFKDGKTVTDSRSITPDSKTEPEDAEPKGFLQRLAGLFSF
jgi:ATP-binding cassette subfamily B protein